MMGAHKCVDDRAQGLTGGHHMWPGKGKVVQLEAVEQLHDGGEGGLSSFERGRDRERSTQ
jgi:hypothetical protein